MYKLGVIEESLKNKNLLETLKPYLYSQKIENVPTDTVPVWHTNEYHLEEDELLSLIDVLKDNVKETWYIHAFDVQKQSKGRATQIINTQSRMSKQKCTSLEESVTEKRGIYEVQTLEFH